MICVECEVRRTYGCADYERSGDELLVLSQTNDTVLVRCAEDPARTWTLHCEDGQWITSDRRQVDCRSNYPLRPSEDSGTTGLTAGLGDQGTCTLAVLGIVRHNGRLCMKVSTLD